MSTEENKAIAHHFWDAYNQRNVAVFDELCAADFVLHDPPFGEIALEDLKMAVAQMVLPAYPDGRWTVEDTIAVGEKVVTRFTFSGTQKGELMGISPTDNKVMVTGIAIFHVSNGKIVEMWGNMDYLGMFQQLGAIPPLGAGEE
jgi:steroid delta-isomerase-like uncharacterized protein